MLSRIRRLVSQGALAGQSSSDALSRELDSLEDRLREEKKRTELLAKISYAKWKLRKEEEKQYAIRYGVSLPSTTLQRQQDDFFTALEARLENERIDFIERRQAIEHQRREDERLRIEHQATERVLRVLENDLA